MRRPGNFPPAVSQGRPWRGLITEEIGLDDGVTVLQQLGLITAA